MEDFKEAELYPPLKKFFEKQGYVVKGEVKGCDMAMAKGNELVVVELKKSFNMSLLYQALDRKRVANGVYIAIPRRAFMKNRAHILHILEKLDIGLVTVAMDSPVKTVAAHLMPKMGAKRNTARARALAAEMNGRTFDGNVGGSTRRKLLTAHRERNLHIACVLEKNGQGTAAQLVKEYGCYKSTGQTLNRNFYGWFVKLEKGVYALSEAGQAALGDPQFGEIVEYYRGKMNIDS
jgi:hypothetical protein